MSELVICKHNELIENFIFNATELELQILNYAIATTNPKWENKNIIYRVTVAQLVKVYQTKSHNTYAHYSKALDRLMKRTYSFYPEGEEDIKRTENVIIRVDENAKEKWFEFKFNKYISERITNLQGLFTKYDIGNIAMFKSRYAFILYDSFRMKIDQLPEDVNVYRQKISIDKFKENLDLTDKYKRFDDLQKKVLNIAKVNINKHSNIRFSYEVIKNGRTPSYIKFTAQQKNPSKDPSIEKQTDWIDDSTSKTTNSEKHVYNMTDDKKAKLRSEFKNILNS